MRIVAEMNDELSMRLGLAEPGDTPADHVAALCDKYELAATLHAAGFINDTDMAKLRAHFIAELNKP